MASQPIKLSSPTHEAAFRALAQWFADDAEGVARVTRVLRSWQGDKGEDALPANANQLPWLRLTPGMGPTEAVAILGAGVRSYHSPLMITVETAVAGSDVGDSLKLWDAVLTRFLAWPIAAFNALGISDIDVEQPAASENDSDFTMATGKLRLDIYIDG